MRTSLLATLLVGAVATACTNGGSLDDGRGEMPPRTDSTEGGSTPASPAPRAASPLVVKIDNAPEARPQTGLDAADLVYAEQVEGGLSRLMAVYATRLPDAVGPVRSARESDLELLRQFHEPTLAFSGAQTALLPLIDKAPLRTALPEEKAAAYYRGRDKPSPHNLYLRPRRLLASTPGTDALTTGFRFGAPPAGGTAERTRTVRFPAARFTFDWSGEQRRWLVSMDDTPTVTTGGKRAAASTVVVQYVKVRESRYHDYLGNNTPYTETVGSGTAKVLRDGKSFDADWKRLSATGGTEFTTKDGTPMNFAEGQVWVVFATAP
ncbi:DUF3048 domain-containing protein [Streptomyces aurantiacus]|uniref:DUF3048 domain-containing protein n=1 Tax=Streptomyces aurantiacus TaxID=47760 RepID=A0A7G1NV63_9ACTN|nr:DUF3048 domain-containing protein [Streptomyces aurantiacus]BCL26341.1 hypothetical protein GCM10017557_12000 [Streptomyces aurantiacus]